MYCENVINTTHSFNFHNATLVGGRVFFERQKAMAQAGENLVSEVTELICAGSPKLRSNVTVDYRMNSVKRWVHFKLYVLEEVELRVRLKGVEATEAFELKKLIQDRVLEIMKSDPSLAGKMVRLDIQETT